MIKYQGKIDPECLNICNAMNSFPGIHTIDSCCGHGERPYRIFFIADKLEDLPRVLYYFDACHCGFGGWIVKIKTDCSMCFPHFMLEGPVGDEAYEQANKIAQYLAEELANPSKGE